MDQRALRLMGGMILLANCLPGAWARQEPQKPPSISASARLAAGRTVFLKNAGGSKIPFDVISGAVAEWGRYPLVDSPEKADLIFEVVSPDENGNVSVTGSTGIQPSGRPQDSTTTTRELPATDVKLTIYDAKSKLALWSAREKAKAAMKQKAREDNLVQAAQRLMTALRERAEK